MARVGGYPTTTRTGEDLELLLRLIVADAQFQHVAGPILIVRQHPAFQISAAPEHALMRARDRVRMTDTVNRILYESGKQLSLLDKLIWASYGWDAYRNRSQIDPESEATRARILYAGVLRLRRLLASMHRRTGGGSLGRLFAGSPLTPEQRDALREIGYDLRYA